MYKNDCVCVHATHTHFKQTFNSEFIIIMIITSFNIQ